MGVGFNTLSPFWPEDPLLFVLGKDVELSAPPVMLSLVIVSVHSSKTLIKTHADFRLQSKALL